jgi:hypothetical protein
VLAFRLTSRSHRARGPIPPPIPTNSQTSTRRVLGHNLGEGGFVTIPIVIELTQ